MGGIPGRVSEPMAYLVLTEAGIVRETDDIRRAPRLHRDVGVPVG